MKRITIPLLLCFLIGIAAQVAGAQTRPRRVGSTPPAQPQQQSTPVQSRDESTPRSDSSAPPVLRGANRDPNEQRPASAPTKDPGPEEIADGDIVRVETTLVSIPVSVMDRDGKYIPNLRKEDFHVWENGVEQQVAYFASTEKPFTVALLIDTSGSTRFKIGEIQDAAIAFVNQLRPDDRVMVVSFNDKIKVLSQLTNNRDALRRAILQTEIGSGTRLYDAVDTVINQYLNRIEGRKAVVLFTDGVDTSSKNATYESTVRDAEELDALVYPVEYDTFSDMGGNGSGGSRRNGGGGGGRGGGGNNRNGSKGGFWNILGGILNGDDDNNNRNSGGYPGGGYPNGGGRNSRRRGGGNNNGNGTSSEEYQLGERYLNDLARVTGARLYNAEQQNVSYAFQMVAEELRRQYSLGYYPKKTPQTGERRSLRVKVDQPELVVRSRDSYVFGQNNGATTAKGQQPAPQAKPPVLKKDLVGAGR